MKTIKRQNRPDMKKIGHRVQFDSRLIRHQIRKWKKTTRPGFFENIGEISSQWKNGESPT